MKRFSLLWVLVLIFLLYLPAVAKMPTREQLLLTAVEQGNQKRVEFFLSKGADVDARDGHGWTALMHAASTGDTAIGKLLLANGAKLELRDNAGTTAVGIACDKGREEMVSLLLERGANLHAKDEYGLDPLMRSAKRGHLGLVRMLLDKGGNLHVSSSVGDNALMLAAKGGYRPVVDVLLERGSRIAVPGRMGQEVIVAAIQGNVSKIKELESQGADIQAKTAGGGARDGLFWASAMGNAEVAEFFLAQEALESPAQKDKAKAKPKKKGDDSLLYAAKNGKTDITTLLLSHDRDPNYKDADGDTALTLAAQAGHQAIVAALIEAGCDLNMKNGDGDTALILAVKNGNLETAKLLLSKNIDVDARDKKGKTALFCAVANDDSPMVSAILNKKPKLDIKDNDGWTPNHEAARNGFTEVLELLCDAGGDVNSKATTQSKSPLMLAAVKGSLDTVRLLLDRGADVNAKDNEGCGPLFLAAEGGFPEVARLLLDRGADFNAESKEGVTPLMVAAYEGRRDVAELLINRGAPLDARSSRHGINALWVAAWRGKTDVLDYLWQHGGDVNVTSKKGESPLMAAVQTGQLDAVRMILERGVDPDIKTKGGLTATEFARKSGQFHLAWLMNAYKAVGIRALGKQKGGQLGVNIQDLNESLAKSFGRDSTEGALVSSVIKGSPAATAGIQEGDIILRFKGEPVPGAAQLSNMIGAEKPGSNAEISVFRNGVFLNVSVKLGERALRDFYEALLKYTPKNGIEYVLYPPTRPPSDHSYYLFHGKVYSESSGLIIVEIPVSDYNLGRYWAFEMPKTAGFSPRVRTEIMVIGKVSNVLDGQTVMRKPLHAAVVKPVAIADGDGKLLSWGDK